MRIARTVLVLAMALLVASPLLAAPKKAVQKKAPQCPAAERVDRIVQGLTLTAEQKTSLDAVKKEFGPKLMEALKKRDVLTPDQKKAKEAAAKEAKAAGKKGKDFSQAVEAAVKLTDEQKAKQAAANKEIGGLEKQLREKVTAVLTAEQKEILKKAQEAKKKKPAK